MKRLIMINGTMGVGKSTISSLLNETLDKSVYLDGDWCWNMSPFVVNETTKHMVQNNIVSLLNNFINSSQFENIIFCWVMHEERIIEELLAKIDLKDYQLYKFSIVCDKEVLIRRLTKDIELGKRDKSLLERTLPRLECYEKMDTIKVDVSDKTPIEALDWMIKQMRDE